MTDEQPDEGRGWGGGPGPLTGLSVAQMASLWPGAGFWQTAAIAAAGIESIVHRRPCARLSRRCP